MNELGIFEQVLANSLASLLMTGLGIYLSATGEHRTKRKLYMGVFMGLAVVGLILSTISAKRAESGRTTEQAGAKLNQEKLSSQLQELGTANSYLRGKLDVIGTVLGAMATKPSDTSQIASLLSKSLRGVSVPSPNTRDAERELQRRMGATVVKGEQLRQACVLNRMKNFQLLEAWDSEATSELTEKFGVDILNKAIMMTNDYIPPGWESKRECWYFIERLNSFQEAIREYAEPAKIPSGR